MISGNNVPILSNNYLNAFFEKRMLIFLPFRGAYDKIDLSNDFVFFLRVRKEIHLLTKEGRKDATNE
jgi:hypothetical protein